MGYWKPDYERKLRDVLAVFRITSPDGVDSEEAAAIVAGGSATVTSSVVWTDRLAESECYRAKAFKVERVPGSSEQVVRIYRLRPRPFRRGFNCKLQSASIIGTDGEGRFTKLCAATAAPTRPASAID